MAPGGCWRLGGATIVALAALAVTSGPAGAQKPPPNPDYQLTDRWVDHAGHFEIEIQNLDVRGSITSFTWRPPPSMKVTAVTSARGGKCKLRADGIVACHGLLPPPSCKVAKTKGSGADCSPLPGGAVTIDLTAKLTGAVKGASFSENLFSGSFDQLKITGMRPGPPPV
jgi:hypothetical protein